MMTREELIEKLEAALMPLEVEGNAAHNAARRLADVLLDLTAQPKPNWQPMLPMNQYAKAWDALSRKEQRQVMDAFPDWDEKMLQSAKWEDTRE